MSEIKYNIYIKTEINLHIYKLKCQLLYKSSIIFNTSYNGIVCDYIEMISFNGLVCDYIEMISFDGVMCDFRQ